MAKMKLDFKALLLNHAEKMGAGAIALLSVAGITTANWSACNLDPLALRGDADKTKSTWLAGSLPEDKKKELEVALKNHDKANPIPIIRTLSGRALTDENGKPLATAPTVEQLEGKKKREGEETLETVAEEMGV